MRKLLLLAIALAMAACAAMAQFDFGGGESKPVWEQFKLNPKSRVKLDFRNANVDSVLAFIQKATGITIVKDPNLKEPLTLTSAGQVSLSEALQILNAALGLRNFEMRKDGNLLVIRQRQTRGGAGGRGGEMTGFDPAMLSAFGAQSQGVLRVYPLKFANATQVARVLNEVFSQQQGGSGLEQLMAQFGGGNRFGGGAQGGRGNQGGFTGGRTGFSGRSQSTVRASADDFSNSVIVNAPDREQGQVKDLIDKLDKETEQPQKAKVYKLQFAVAEEMAPVVQNVLVSNAPRGRGGVGSSNIPIEQRFQQAFRLGGAQAAFGTVVADVRTNSLVVTATDENQVLVDQVIKELDTEVQVQTSTFVFPLANARADQMANLLNQAFGTRQGAGGGGGLGQNRNLNQNRNQNRGGLGGGGGAGGLGGGGGGGGRGIDDPASDLQLNLADPEAEFGELATQVTVDQSQMLAQFQGGGGGGGFFRPQQPTRTGQAGRDADGRVVNVRDLTGQVTTIPDQNTNSIIVVTTPENAELIKNILSQLDKIPEQVLIETIIVEATLDANSKLGVEWQYNRANNQTNQTGTIGPDFGLRRANPPLEGLRYTLTGGSLEGFLSALATDKKFQVLSTPRIFTSNNVQAQINISQSVPYVLSTREDPNGNLTFNYAFQDVGIVLTVTPRVTANGYVTMDVSQTANDLQGFTTFNAPIVNQRQADTTVSVRDGETIILGGIIRSTVSTTVRKVPLLGDIPLLGELFKTTDKSNVKTELLVFLTPRVVRNPEDAKKLREEQTKRLTPGTQKQIEKATPPEKGTGAPPGGKPNDK
ncbi:MAG TPA: secretin N-terminal domain-containing protein [Fimbriimonadaceae bacterium]|nr:secretin N-terminal domain-containing protein [Fimbriimonadaceae bacterium]